MPVFGGIFGGLRRQTEAMTLSAKSGLSSNPAKHLPTGQTHCH
jgi:hypothetical protein